uniref:DNA damage-binding protein 1 n=1 Tax=Angiostrongylus cantonensis TaxID=6313 RepID=A0A158PBW5_ANGCA
MPRVQNLVKIVSFKMIYSVKIGMRLSLDPDTREAVVMLTNRLICRCSIRTGENKTFMIDNDITPDELRQCSDFYLLADNIAVLLTYNVENYHFSQYVLLLNDITENATLIMKRTTTLPALNSGLTVGNTGMGLLDEGFLMVTGYTGPEGIHRQVVGHLIAADPLNASVFPNQDITLMIRQFERFLVNHDEDLGIFPSGILAEKNGLVFLLKKYGTNLIRKKKKELLEFMIEDKVEAGKYIHVTFNFSSEFDLFESTLVGRASFASKIKCVLPSGHILLRPSMIPVTAPPPTFNMYGLDMNSFKFKQVPIKPKLHSNENSLISYPLAIDCDRSGGVITAELGSSLKNFPAFEKSPLIRRSVGQLNWELL